MNDKPTPTLPEVVTTLEMENAAVEIAALHWKNPLADLLTRGIYVFSDSVTDDSVLKAKTELTLWDKMYPSSPLTIYFTSPGGIVYSGFGLHDHIKGMTADHEVTVKVRGMAASMGGILLQAASKGRRFVSKHSKVLVHPVSTHFGDRLNSQDARHQAKMMDDMWNHCLQVLTSHRDGQHVIDAGELKKLVGRDDMWFSAEEAVKYNVADQIG